MWPAFQNRALTPAAGSNQRQFGQMICFHPPHYDSVPIREAVSRLKTVDPNSPDVQAARALGICFGDRAEIGDPFEAASLAAAPEKPALALS